MCKCSSESRNSFELNYSICDLGAIPVGIAVARQRLQEHTQTQQPQTKDINRFGNIGITTDLGELSISVFLHIILSR